MPIIRYATLGMQILIRHITSKLPIKMIANSYPLAREKIIHEMLRLRLRTSVRFQNVKITSFITLI